MNIDPELKKRYSGIGLLIVGLILVFVPLRWIYLIIGIGMLMISLPNMLAASTQLQSKHPEVIAIFVRSLINLILSILIILNPGFINVICVVTGIVLIVSNLLNIFFERKYHNIKISFKDLAGLGLALIILLLAGFSGFEKILDIIKIAIGALIGLSGLVLSLSAKPVQPNIQATLDEYERRYQQEHPEENSDIIDVEYEENTENEEK